MDQRRVRMSCVRFVVLGLSFSAVLSLAAQAATAPVGATPGSFSVDPNGGANYTIPIQIPPGSAGMAPSVALTYSKQVDNPLVGVGFSISGLSIISRCGSTKVLDGIKGGVYYDSRDRFCLDGQRLIAVNGVYGAHGTEYRTERESFAKIFSYDTSVCGLDNGVAPSSGPACFKVFSKDGTVSEYGVSPDSRIQAQGKTVVRLWALDKVQDTRGNYYTVSYAEDNTNGEYRPLKIDYTGNANAGLAPYNSVSFVYVSRTDIVPLYEAGSVIKVTQRLTNVQTYADATLVRDYRLSYDNNGAPQGPTGRSRLVSMQECGSDGVCLPATIFAWELASVGFASAEIAWPQCDYLDTVPPRWYCPPGADVNTTTYGLWNRDHTNIIPGDFDGDGKTDLIKQDDATTYQKATLYRSNGDGTFTAVAIIPGYWDRNHVNIILGDFNGDGRTDFIKQTDNAADDLGVYLSNGDGTFTFTSVTWPRCEYVDTVPPRWWCDPGGSVTTTNYGFWNRTYTKLITGDFDGDGKTDFIKQDSATFGGKATLYRSKGDGTFTSVAMDSPGSWDFAHVNIIPGDFNGDGKLDLIKQTDSTMQSLGTVYLSVGDGTFTTVDMGSPGTWSWDYTSLIPGDFNGDGKTDFIKQNGTSWQYQGSAILYSNTPAGVSDVLASITNGLGAQTTITPKPLTDSSVYTKDPSVSCLQPNPPPTNLAAANVNCYPYQNVQAAIYVVSRVTQSDGIGGVR